MQSRNLKYYIFEKWMHVCAYQSEHKLTGRRTDRQQHTLNFVRSSLILSAAIYDRKLHNIFCVVVYREQLKRILCIYHMESLRLVLQKYKPNNETENLLVPDNVEFILGDFLNKTINNIHAIFRRKNDFVNLKKERFFQCSQSSN